MGHRDLLDPVLRYRVDTVASTVSTTTTIGAAYHAGCEMFVAGTAVFGAPNPAAAVAGLKAACIPGSFA